MRKHIYAAPVHAGEPWTNELDTAVHDLTAQDVPTETIAALLGRTEGAIKSRMHLHDAFMNGFYAALMTTKF
jgi:hypothetical protein